MVQGRGGLCVGKWEDFSLLVPLTSCCHIPALSCFCCVQGDCNPMEAPRASTSTAQHMPLASTDESCHPGCSGENLLGRKISLLRPADLAIKTQTSFYLFLSTEKFVPENLAIFPATDIVAPKRKRGYNFFL